MQFKCLFIRFSRALKKRCMENELHKVWKKLSAFTAVMCCKIFKLLLKLWFDHF